MMYKIPKALLLILATIFLGGCASKVITNAKDFKRSYVLTLKIPHIRFHDGAFLFKKNQELYIKPLAFGKRLSTIKITPRLICLNSTCLAKNAFNAKYLHISYNADTLEKILLAQPIFDQQGFKKKNNGFTQSYKHISYKVDRGNVYFKDKLHKILIKLRRIKG